MEFLVDPHHLPDEIVVEILSWLPYKHVHRCRVVCKLWLALTSSSHFVHLHLNRSNPLPVLLVQTLPSSVTDWETNNSVALFMLHEGREEEVLTPNGSALIAKRICDGVFKLSKGEHLLLVTSSYGLVVFRHMSCGSRYEVWNLLTRERVTVKVPLELLAEKENYWDYSCVHAIFVYPPTKEYRMLLACPARQDDESILFHFYIYSFNTKLWRKLPDSSCLPYSPKRIDNPVVLHSGTTLHWMAGRCYGTITPCTSWIIIFDIQTEEFRLRPRPGEECPSRFLHKHMCISETKDGLLSFCSMVTPVVNIYVLEDYNNWSWTKRHTIDLSHAFSNESLDRICIIRGHNYKLLVQFEEKLCLIDLEDDKKNIKVVDKTTIMGDLKSLTVVPLSYTESTVSLYQMNPDLLLGLNYQFENRFQLYENRKD